MSFRDAMTPELVLDPEGEGILFDLRALLSSRLLVQGSSRSGKSYMLRYILERSADLIPQLIIDWEGEFSTLREVHPYVWVGHLDDGADLPVQASTARAHCRRLIPSGASVIVDVSELEPEDRYEVVALWLHELMHLPKVHRCPLLVAIDEAHELAPQDEDVPSRKAVRSVIARGGKRGVCAIVATQRLAKLDKNVAETQTRLIGRTTLDVDWERSAKELGLRRDQWHELKELPKGHFFAYGPAIGDGTLTLVKAGAIRSHHPDVTQNAFTAPPTPAAIAAALENLRTDTGDVADDASRQELLEELERLKVENRRIREEGASDPVDIKRAVEAAVKPLGEEIERLRLINERSRNHARAILLDNEEIPPGSEELAVPETEPADERRANAAEQVAEDGPRVFEEPILHVLGKRKTPISREDLADRIGSSAKSSTFRSELSRLRQESRILYPSRGYVALVPEGSA